MTEGKREMTKLVAGCLSVSLVFITACDQESKLRELQHQADERVAKAEREAKDKVQTLEKEVEALKADMADASAQAKTATETAIQEAKASSEEQAKLASEAIAKARTAYKAEAHAKLSALEKDAREVSAKAGHAPAKLKSALAKPLKELSESQKAITKDIASFDSATLETFGKVKAKVEQDLAKLKRAISAVRSKLPNK
jgi:hypothetical protein